MVALGFVIGFLVGWVVVIGVCCWATWARDRERRRTDE